MRRRLGDALLFLAVFAVAFFYRFNTLGGALGGFTNDEFGYLSRARQIQAGEVPFRDFNDPGWFLTDALSAAAQWLGGYNLRSEALLTIAMLALGAALTFALARRISGSLVAALVAIALHIALEPRHYNYPKIVLYAAGLALAWRYVERPGRIRLCALGVLIGVAFLFRHDHLVYLGALGLLTIALVHRASMSAFVRAAAGLGAAIAACIVPFLLFLALNGGVGDYFRTALVYVTRDAQRTSFSFPRFSIEPTKPLLTLTRAAAPQDTRINVRWTQASDQQRRERESRYGLAEGTERDGTWSYQLRDASSANIEALVRDPFVDDTHGVDRVRFTVEEQPLHLESQLDTVQNATAYLYYFLLALPAIAAVILLRIRRAGGSTRAASDAPRLVPLLVLAALLNVSFLSRGSTNIRIADVGVTAAIIIAWMISALATRGGQHVFPKRGAGALARVAGVVLLGLAFLSANSLGDVWRHVREAYVASGPTQVVTKAGLVWQELGASPALFTTDAEQPSILKIAAYVQACTEPADRLFVLGSYPELYYFADRLFAGGHAWLLPLYYSDDVDEARILMRLRNARVPIILTENQSEYDRDYRPVFEQIDAYLRDTYTQGGEVDAGGPRPLRVLVRKDLDVRRRYQPFDLPCFTLAAPSPSGRS